MRVFWDGDVKKRAPLHVPEEGPVAFLADHYDLVIAGYKHRVIVAKDKDEDGVPFSDDALRRMEVQWRRFHGEEVESASDQEEEEEVDEEEPELSSSEDELPVQRKKRARYT